MKRVTSLMMNNNYFILAFAVVVFGLKLILDDYEIPGKYVPVFAGLKTVFLIVFIACFLYVLSFFVFVLVTKNKANHGWENLENREKEDKREKLLKIYMQGLLISIPFTLYGLMIYLAAYQTWRQVLVFVVAFVIIRIINHFQKNKNHLQQDYKSISPPNINQG
jgi:hypothetical protein